MTLVDQVTGLLSLLTLIADVILVISLGLLLYAKITKSYNKLMTHRYLQWMRKNGLLLSFIVALAATTSSLFYSEIAGFVPCTLCWYQRILMYPLTILLGIAFEKKDKNIIPYVLTMTGIGSVISLYHYYIQLSPAGAFVPCSAVGISVSCTSREFTHLGYITIPMMAATAFLLIFGILWVTRYAKNSK